MTKVSYTLFKDWAAAASVPGGFSPEQVGLLMSGGSMTLDLEGQLGSRVGVEIRHMETSSLSGEDASYLDETPGERAAEREVWLVVDGKRLVYARTLIPLASIEKGLLRLLEEKGEEPLGRVLASKGITFSKNKLEVGAVVSPPVAADLGIEPSTPLAARRYILFNRKGDGSWLIKAAVTEIFSPEIIPGNPLIN